MKITDKHVLFWGDWPSNWHPAEIKVKDENNNEIRFSNTEQYFMWVKAKTFGDDEMAEQIRIKGKNPKVAKDLGRMVRNYDDKVWNEKRYEVMVKANKYKYSQNEGLKKKLLHETLRDKGFVEASPYDTIWGIGLAKQNADADDESKWRGQNLLGKALDEVRDWLLKQNGEEKI